MQRIGELLGTTRQIEPEKKKRGGINSERADMVGQLIHFMGEDVPTDEEKKLQRATPGAGKAAKDKRLNMRMKYWLGRTRKLEPGQIYALMRKAKEGRNSAALFNWLLKNHGKPKV